MHVHSPATQTLYTQLFEATTAYDVELTGGFGQGLVVERAVRQRGSSTAAILVGSPAELGVDALHLLVGLVPSVGSAEARNGGLQDHEEGFEFWCRSA
jgi:hypothetical protein